jgi:hypothetical protein
MHPVGMLWTAIALARGASGGSGFGGTVEQAQSSRLKQSSVVVFMAPVCDLSQVLIIRQGVERQARIPQAVLAVCTAQAKDGASGE